MTVIGLIVIALFVVAVMTLMSTSTYDTWGGVLIAPVLFLVTLPALRKQAIREGDPRLFNLLCWGLVAKLAGGVARYVLAYAIYGGKGDAFKYSRDAIATADRWAAGHVDLAATIDTPESFITSVTAMIHTVLQPSLLAAFLVFSWLAFWGLLWFYRSFQLAVPEGHPRTYAKLLFFLPSLVYWPSSVGKEAWLIFSLGLASFGAASLLTRARAISVLPMLLGLLGAAAVRPHYAGIAAIALVGAFVIKKPAASLGTLAPVAKLAGVGAVVVLAALLLQRTSAFLTQSGVDVEGGLTSVAGIRDALGDVGVLTEQGGSEFHPPGLTTPIGIVLSAPSVLFRPLPIEAHEGQIMMAALESTVLFVFAAIRWRWIWTSLRSLRRLPYVAYLVGFVIGGILVLATVANFGILVRQRTLILPAVLVLLCIAPPHKTATRKTGWEQGTASEMAHAA